MGDTRGASACAVVATCLHAGCFAPQPPEGAPCGEHGGCPEGQICAAAVCTAVDTFRWDPPRILSELDDPEGNQDPSVTADLLTIVWSSGRDGGKGHGDIWMAHRGSLDEPFGDIHDVFAINSGADDTSPEIYPDGSAIFFTSDRGGDDDIWASVRDSDGAYGDPFRIDEVSRGDHDESELALTPDGLIAFVVRDNHFFRSLRDSATSGFGELVPIPELDIAADVASPTLGDHANVVYFHAGDPRQLYVSRLVPDGTYSPPILVRELDTDERNADPFITGDERHIVWNRGDQILESQR